MVLGILNKSVELWKWKHIRLISCNLKTEAIKEKSELKDKK